MDGNATNGPRSTNDKWRVVWRVFFAAIFLISVGGGLRNIYQIRTGSFSLDSFQAVVDFSSNMFALFAVATLAILNTLGVFDLKGWLAQLASDRSAQSDDHA